MYFFRDAATRIQYIYYYEVTYLSLSCFKLDDTSYNYQSKLLSHCYD